MRKGRGSCGALNRSKKKPTVWGKYWISTRVATRLPMISLRWPRLKMEATIPSVMSET